LRVFCYRYPGQRQVSAYFIVVDVSNLRCRARIAACSRGFNLSGSLLTQCTIPSIRTQLADSGREWTPAQGLGLILQAMQANGSGRLGVPSVIPASSTPSSAEAFCRDTATTSWGPVEHWGIITMICSEDIDLVQTEDEPIGATVDAVRDALSWLGKCNREQAGHSIHLVFRFSPESAPDARLKLKVEVNTREHGSLLGIRKHPFVVDSSWYQSGANIASFEPEELVGNKLRALLQRRKNRDLFDLNEGLEQLAINPDKLITCFDHYLKLEGKPMTRATAEQ
jgi:hypothetical protein